MTDLFFDYETRSAVDIKHGLDVYARAVEPTVLCWSLDDGPIHTWEIGMCRPERFINLAYNPEISLVAHNVTFDAAVLHRAWGLYVPPERLHCTSARAYAHSLPGSLEAAGAALGLPLDKQKTAEGRKLVLLFCKPNKQGKYNDRDSHPEEWAAFVEYCRQDVVALREIHARLPAYNYQGEHKLIWDLDQRINQRGFHVDLDLARAAIKVTEEGKKRSDKALDKLTSGHVTSAGQRDRILMHLVGEDGVNLVDLKASTLRQTLENEELDEASRLLLELRLEGGKNSASKYKRLLESTGPDGRLRYTLQYGGGSRTGRWAGRIFQPHNLPRPSVHDADYIEEVIVPGIKSGAVLAPGAELVYGTPATACADALRSAIEAAYGRELVVADWSNIEGRMLAWLAGEDWKLRAFREYDAGIGPDLYKLIYSRSFSKPLDELTKDDRQVGKCQDLGCGFGGSVGAFVTFASVYGISLDGLADTVPPTVSKEVWGKAQESHDWAVKNERDYGLDRDVFAACHALVQVYRQSHPATVRFWYDLHDACKDAVRQPGTVRTVGLLKVWRSGAWLIIQLPSGRRLLYAKPEIRRGDDDKEVLTYMNARAKQWRRIPSWHGLLVENVVQAAANDVLRAALLRVDPEAPVVLHVHDEIVTEPEKGTFPLERLIHLMTQPMPWSRGLPLAAAGYVADRYRKE